MAGRPKEFSREAVLSSAMDLFWSEGYEAASVRDIEDETGIGRQSIYNEFGDKRNLFLEAVSQYDETVTQSFIDIINSDGSPAMNIRKWLELLVKASTGRNPKGCLLTNSAMSVGSNDQTLVDAASDALKRLERALRSAVERAIDVGELPKATNVAAMASYLLGAGQGILVLGRLGHSTPRLRDVISVALLAFSGTPRA